MEEIESTYADCPKCGVHYSKLTKHRCFVEDEAPPMPESGHDGDGDDDREEGKDGGRGQGGDNEAEGDGDGQGEGEGEGDGGEGEGEPQPQPPEPDAPPVAVVCTVLKFAALSSECAKNGSIEVTLTEEGLMIYGHNGDLTAVAVIPWGEFEKRSTLDGEFFVKEAVDEVDAKLLPPDEDVERVRRMIEQAKVDKVKAMAEKPKAKRKKADKVDILGLPLNEGQRVRASNGHVGTVTGDVINTLVRVTYDKGGDWWHVAADGQFERASGKDVKNEWDLVSNA